MHVANHYHTEGIKPYSIKAIITSTATGQSTQHPSRRWLSCSAATGCRCQCRSPPRRCSLPTGRTRGNQIPARRV